MRHLLFAALLVPASLSWAGDKDIRYISVSGTRLLSRPSAFSRALSKLNAATAVEVLSKKGAYLKVHVGQNNGWIAAYSVQATRPKIGANAAQSQDTSAEEVAAATKGFNSDVEAQYKKNNPNLDYGQLDKLEARTKVANPVDSLKDFRRIGKLGEFAEGGEND